MRAHIQDMLAWVAENEIACIPQEFCDHAGISRTTLKRHEDLAELVNHYGWKTSRARMRYGSSTRTVRARERVDSRILREHGRWKVDNEKLTDQLSGAQAQIDQLRADVQRLTAYAALLENYTDVLVHELAMRDRQSGRRIGLLLQSVRDETHSTEFMEKIRQSNRELISGQEPRTITAHAAPPVAAHSNEDRPARRQRTRA
jgi:hypothetical protein